MQYGLGPPMIFGPAGNNRPDEARPNIAAWRRR
jgi:hypothetical protein